MIDLLENVVCIMLGFLIGAFILEPIFRSVLW
jgi:uncharacterized protein YneF (UPF0154 family)